VKPTINADQEKLKL